MIGKKFAHVYNQPNGFTLLEILFCLALSAMILMMSVMWSTSYLERRNLTQTIQEMQSHFHLARLLGLISSRDVILCPAEKNQCSSNWSLPWRIMQKQSCLMQFSKFPNGVTLTRIALQRGPLILPKNKEAAALSGHFLVMTAHWQQRLTLTREGDLHVDSQNPQWLPTVQENQD